MSSSRFSNQAGLEVVPDGGGIPHVVEGPTILGKPADGAAYNQQGVFHQNASPSSAYPPSNYLAQSQGYMRSSHDGTYVTDKFPASSVPPTGERVLGLKRKTFWLIFGPLIALLVIGLAVGLGVGLGTSHHDSSTSSGTPTTTSPASASSTPAAPTPLACPNANGTLYSKAGDDPFLILCSIDYNGNDGRGTRDIAQQNTSSVEDCIDLCSNNSSCAGAGWGNTGTGYNTCYMKGTLGGSQGATPDWFFAIRE